MLANNPDVRHTENDKKFVKFTITTTEVFWNTRGERIKETQWHNIIAWDKVADVVEKYLAKGHEIAIEGRLLTKRYTDKEGNARYVTEVQANELLILGSSIAKDKR